MGGDETRGQPLTLVRVGQRDRQRVEGSRVGKEQSREATEYGGKARTSAGADRVFRM